MGVTSPENLQFQQGDDFVAARLSIDIPTEGISTLRELTQEMERFRVTAESAARAQGSFIEYLRVSTEEGQRFAESMTNLIETLQRASETQQRLATGSVMPSGALPQGSSVPSGYVDPFADSLAGRGRTAGMSMEDAQARIDSLRETDPRAYINMQAQRGGILPGEMPVRPDESQLAAVAARINQREQAAVRQIQANPPAPPSGGWQETMGNAQGLAQKVASEIGPGGTNIALMGAMAAGFKRLSAAAPGGIEGGAMANIVKGAGYVGAGMTAGLAAFGLTQHVGETLAAYGAQGTIRGGGIGAGISQEIAIRTMAMNPFLTNEQSRQIIQAALSEGYTGKSFDSVTQFIATNLRDMNIQVADSVELLRKNVNEGGQSIAELATSLSVIKGLSSQGARSLPELIAEFKHTSDAAISAGVSGPQAAQAAMVMSQVWSDDMSLKGQMGSLYAATLQNPSAMTTLSVLAGHRPTPGALPGTEFARMPDAGRGVMVEGVRRLAQMAYQSGRGDMLNAARIFQILLSQHFPGHPATTDLTLARKMLVELLNGENPLEQAEQQVNEQQERAVTPQSKGIFEGIGGMIGGILQTQWRGPVSSIRTLGSMIADATTSNWQGLGTYAEKFTKGIEPGLRHMNPFDMKMPVLQAIEDEFGSRGYEILDRQGNVVDFSKSSREQMEALARGDLTWRPKGASGPGHTVRETAGLSGEDLRNILKASRQELTGSVTIGLTPEASRLLQVQGGRNTIRLTPHEERANAGWGGATPNNAPPGETVLSRGRSGW